ncbi:MAG TPA: hypothetical protein VJH92_00250 [Candidatus Nanoarchaeia archaeon]|nr:hypothetical protein [Candidatus Nanoarchaeia archaeon]
MKKSPYFIVKDHKGEVLYSGQSSSHFLNARNKAITQINRSRSQDRRGYSYSVTQIDKEGSSISLISSTYHPLAIETPVEGRSPRDEVREFRLGSEELKGLLKLLEQK